jgi:thymidylate kinase
MLSISKELFSAWNNAELLYCHWKSNEHLLEGLNGETDLDVLLSHHDKDRGEELLRQLDFLKCKSQVGSRYPDVDDWIGFDKPTGSLIHVHLHYSIVTGHKGLKEYDLPWSELALDTRVYNAEYGVYTMEPNLEMVTLYTRIGLKADITTLFRSRIGKYHYDKDAKREIEWLKKRVDLNRVRQLLELYYKDKAKQVLEIMGLETIEASSYRKLRKIAEETFKSNRRVHGFIRLRELYFLVYHTLIKKTIQKFKPLITKKIPASEKGVSIAFLGQDGAGKTTVTQKLIKWWNWKMDIRYLYFGSGENYSSWKKRLSNKLPSNRVFKYLKAALVIIDLRDVQRHAYRSIKRAQKYIKKGGVAIYDRFPQNEYPGICDGPKIRLFLSKNMGNGLLTRLLLPFAHSEEKYINKILFYSPDVVFKLILPPEESIRRKPQENLEMVSRKHEIIKSLAFEGSDVYTIDATMPFDKEIVLLKNTIWQHLQK